MPCTELEENKIDRGQIGRKKPIQAIRPDIHGNGCAAPKASWINAKGASLSSLTGRLCYPTEVALGWVAPDGIQGRKIGTFSTPGSCASELINSAAIRFGGVEEAVKTEPDPYCPCRRPVPELEQMRRAAAIRTAEARHGNGRIWHGA